MALIDDELTRLLKNHMRSDLGDKVDSLFAFPQPLAFMSMKLRFTLALGLVPEPYVKDMRTIRKIRNRMAHTAEPMSFATPEIKDAFASTEASKDSIGPALDAIREGHRAEEGRVERDPVRRPAVEFAGHTADGRLLGARRRRPLG